MGSCTGVVSHGIEHILDIEVRHGTALNNVIGQYMQRRRFVLSGIF